MATDSVRFSKETVETREQYILNRTSGKRRVAVRTGLELVEHGIKVTRPHE